MMIIKDYYKKYNNSSNINIDRFVSNTQINSTLHKFIHLCIRHNISLLHYNKDNHVTLKSVQELLEECQKLKVSSCNKAIVSLAKIRDCSDCDFIDVKVNIDKTSADLKNILKDLDIICDMLKNVYTDVILAEQFQISNHLRFNKHNYGFIEEFSNSFSYNKKT